MKKGADVTTQPNLDPDPFTQFRKWYDEAVSAGVQQLDAMTLATATKEGKPSARLVFYKGINNKRFLFYTNYESQKGRELLQNPMAALVFYWPSLHRQVRVEGDVEKLSYEESNRYFQTRSRESQLGAWASRQSEIIAGREVLEECIARLQHEYEGKEIPCPPFWGGFCLIPDKFEFWIGGANRLHDRFCYLQRADSWEIVRLSP